ncbi:MAG: c-type cytochrome [Deltaproteobacteria bacterium]|nr:c-type cytochrome [Deltaproteobacteria bacterium]
MLDAGLATLILLALPAQSALTSTEAAEAPPATSFFEEVEDETLGPVEIAAAVARGERAFRSHCVTCHGVTGRGDGPSARWLSPRPRDLVRGEFKWRTTPTGEMPTDRDLLRTIDEGAPGTAMPSFRKRLPEQMRRDLVQYVKTFCPRFKQPLPAALDIPEVPGASEELIAQGRALFQRLKCWECHGETGRGDGPSSGTLVDSEGLPIEAYDFTSGVYKGGATPEAIYRTFMTGLNGTPMPSFALSISAGERWPLVFYTLSLHRERGIFDYLFGSLEQQP